MVKRKPTDTRKKKRAAARPQPASLAGTRTTAPRVSKRNVQTGEPSAGEGGNGSRKPARSRTAGFPVVGIGGSAGSLEALGELLEHLPPEPGIALVVVSHLDPTHESSLAVILGRKTQMPVAQAESGTRVKPDNVYVIPPGRRIEISKGVLSVPARPPRDGPVTTVDHFLRSLAADQQADAVAVVLSGTATDGALGVKAVKEAGGITFAQDPESARHPGMPQAAIDTQCVDLVMTPRKVAAELAQLPGHPYVREASEGAATAQMLPEGESLERLFALLRNKTGLDFRQYNRSTVRRRILRRMVLHRATGLDTYVAFVEQRPDEVEALFNDILINVTHFFRDPKTFDFLETRIYPMIIKNQAGDQPIRIWVAGCATGEEVYSIAAGLLSVMSDSAVHYPIQVFATDVSEPALEVARRGVYPESIAADVPAERLRRFFVKVPGGYQVARSMRELCIFSRHNLIKDAPFSRMDLVSCRNLLIYLGPALQNRAIPRLHYALKPAGYMLLGTSENVGAYTNLFAPVDRKFRVFSKKLAPTPLHLDLSRDEAAFERGARSSAPTAGRPTQAPGASALQAEVDRLMLTRFSPSAVLINGDLDILQVRGRVGNFLEPAHGKASLNLARMAREGLMPALRIAVHQARRANEAVRKTGLRLGSGDDTRMIHFEVVPLGNGSPAERHFLVIFEEAASREPAAELKPGSKNPKASPQELREIDSLRKELAATKRNLRSIIEDQETTNEELTASNEELQSSNEELESTNEELETAKEELESVNEELTTLNEELLNRNEELSSVTNDLTNLLASVNLPIVMVGDDRRIRRFTMPAEKLLDLTPSDVDRPIRGIRPGIDGLELDQIVADVIKKMTAFEREVQDREGRWYVMRVQPYRTGENKIEGAVLAFIDIDALKRGSIELAEIYDYVRAITEIVERPLVVLDNHLRVIFASPLFYETFRVSLSETEGRLFWELGNGQWDIPQLRRHLQQSLKKYTGVHTLTVEHAFPEIGRRTMQVRLRRIPRQGEQTRMMLLEIKDVSGSTGRPPESNGQE